MILNPHTCNQGYLYTYQKVEDDQGNAKLHFLHKVLFQFIHLSRALQTICLSEKILSISFSCLKCTEVPLKFAGLVC